MWFALKHEILMEEVGAVGNLEGIVGLKKRTPITIKLKFIDFKKHIVAPRFIFRKWQLEKLALTDLDLSNICLKDHRGDIWCAKRQEFCYFSKDFGPKRVITLEEASFSKEFKFGEILSLGVIEHCPRCGTLLVEWPHEPFTGMANDPEWIIENI